MSARPVDMDVPAATQAQRRTLRRARIIDAARLLPFLGVLLFLLPDLALSAGPGSEGATAPWLVYLFLAWAVLVVLAIWLSRLHLRLIADASAGGANHDRDAG